MSALTAEHRAPPQMLATRAPLTEAGASAICTGFGYLCGTKVCTEIVRV